MSNSHPGLSGPLALLCLTDFYAPDMNWPAPSPPPARGTFTSPAAFSGSKNLFQAVKSEGTAAQNTTFFAGRTFQRNGAQSALNARPHNARYQKKASAEEWDYRA